MGIKKALNKKKTKDWKSGSSDMAKYMINLDILCCQKSGDEMPIMHKVRKKAHREVIDKHCNTGYYFKSVITYKRLRGCAEEISFCKSVFHGNNNITNFADFEAFFDSKCLC